jgi:hypothetical protein
MGARRKKIDKYGARRVGEQDGARRGIVPRKNAMPDKRNLIPLTRFLQSTHHVFKHALARRNLPARAFCDVGNCPSSIIVLLAVTTSTDQKKIGLVRRPAAPSIRLSCIATWVRCPNSQIFFLYVLSSTS